MIRWSEVQVLISATDCDEKGARVNPLTISVIGAGNAGQAMAADLVNRGHRVLAIYDSAPAAVRAVADRGGVELVGPLMSGVVPLTATGVLEDAVDGADVLLVTVPATAHAAAAEALAGLVRPSHTIVVCPGYVGSTLLFRQALRRRGVEMLPRLVETTTMPFAARLVARGQVGVKGIKKALHLAALPSADTAHAIRAPAAGLPAAPDRRIERARSRIEQPQPDGTRAADGHELGADRGRDVLAAL